MRKYSLKINKKKGQTGMVCPLETNIAGWVYLAFSEE